MLRVSKATSQLQKNEASRKFDFLNEPFIKPCVDEEKFRKHSMNEKMKAGGNFERSLVFVKGLKFTLPHFFVQFVIAVFVLI